MSCGTGTAGPQQAVALGALRWIRERLAGFALSADVLDPGADVNRVLKPLGELAELSASVLWHTAPEDERHGLAGESLAWAWRETGEGAVFAALLREEPFATYPLELYAAFANAGLRNAEVDRFCAVTTRTRGWRLLEQEPNRRLGVLNAERRAGFARHETYPAALRGTWLGGLPEPWTFESGAGYAMTHTVFHLTDWGRAPQRLPRDLARYLAVWLPAWLDGCLEDERWDLACELLAVAASLPEPPDAAASRAAWERIAAARDADGALPEAGPDGPGMAGGRSFWNRYHSTLVAAFAATLATGRLGAEGVGPFSASARGAGGAGRDGTIGAAV